MPRHGTLSVRDALFEGAGAIRSHPLRASLAMLAIAAAVATMATVVVALDGVGRFARTSAARAFGSNTFVLARIASPGQESRRDLELKLRRNPDVTRGDLKFLERYAEGRVEYGATAGRRVEAAAGSRRYEGASLVGATASLAEIRDLAVDRGRFFGVDEERQAALVAVIGATVADELFPGVDPLDRMLRIAGRGFRVIGLQQRQGTVAGASLDRNIWVPLRTYERMFGRPETLQLLGRSPAADEGAVATRAAEDRARVSMRARRQLQPDATDNFDILSPEAGRDFVLSLSQRVGAAAGPISAMALLAAVIVVANTILVSVTQRTREIGIRRAVGASGVQIMAEVLAESVVIGAVGGALGLVVVLGLVALGSGLGVDLVLEARTAAWSLLAAASSGLVAGWYPARVATRIDVVDALRSE